MPILPCLQFVLYFHAFVNSVNYIPTYTICLPFHPIYVYVRRLQSSFLRRNFHPKGTAGRMQCRTRCLVLGPQPRSPISYLLYLISAPTLALVVGVYQAPMIRYICCQQHQNIAGSIETQRKTKCCAGKSRPSGRMGNKRLIIGLPPTRYIWFDCAYNVVMPYRRKGSLEVEIAVVRQLEYVRRDVVAMFLSLRKAYPPSKIFFFPSPLRRSARDVLPYVTSLRLLWQSISTILIECQQLSARFLGSTAWRYRGRFHGEVYKINFRND